jgi:hypothetical protein
MLQHPDLMLANFHAREHELIAEADRHRLLAAARRWRNRSARSHPAVRGRPDIAGPRIAPAR